MKQDQYIIRKYTKQKLIDEQKEEIIKFYKERGHIFGVAGTARKFEIPFERIRYMLKKEGLYTPNKGLGSRKKQQAVS